MLSISARTMPCARLTQVLARVNLGASRGYTTTPPTTEPEVKVKKTRTKLDKSQLPPKRPISAYAKFIMENRHLVTGQTQNPFTALAEQWSAKSASEKEKYKPTQHDWDRFHEAFDQWKESVDPTVLKQINELRKAKGNKAIRKSKQFASGYALYLKDIFATHRLETGEPGKVGGLSKGSAEKWNAMSDAEKQVWKDKAAEVKEEWLKTHGKDV